jgi:O-glycosyl hydrolase
LVRTVGKAREASPALRRGGCVSLKGTVPFLAYARVAGDDVAVVALNHSDQPVTETVAIPPTLPLADGAVLTNVLAPAETLTASDGALVITLPARSAGVFVP